MKKIISLLFVVSIFITNGLYAVGVDLNNLDNNNVVTDTTATTADTINATQAVISMPKDTTDYTELPKVKPPYKAQIWKLTPKTGEITFRIYDPTQERFLDGTVSYINNNLRNNTYPSMEEQVKVDEEIERKQKVFEDRSNGAVNNYYQSIKDYKNQLATENTNATNTSLNKQFLSLSAFMVACLTLDNSVIDIKKSMLLHKVVLQGRYTRDLSSTLATASSANSIIDSTLSKYVERFSIKTFFFILEWNKENNETLNKIKFFLIGIFLPLILGYAGLSKITKKVQKISDFDDWGEKGVVAVGMFLLFFMSNNFYSDGNGGRIDQTTFQKWGVDTVRQAVRFADSLTLGTVTSYSQWQINNLGLMSTEDIKNIYVEKERKKLTMDLYNKFNKVCMTQYNIKKIQAVDSYIKNDDYLFFTDDEYYNAQANWGKKYKDKPFPFGNRDLFYKDPKNPPHLSFTACSQIERDLRTLTKDLNDYRDFDKQMAKIKSQNVTKEVELLTKMNKDGMTYAKYLGFMYAPYILLQDYFVKNLTDENSVLSSVNKEVKFKDKDMESKFIKASSEYDKSLGFPKIAKVDEKLAKLKLELIKALPYKMIPSFGAIQNAFYTPIHDILSLLTHNVVVGGGTSILDLIGYSASNWIAYDFTKSILEFAPAFLMIIAGTWVVIFYLVSLFIYFFVSPYLLAYALGSQQTEALKSFITRGVVLSLKPIMLVLSIVVTLVAVDLTTEILSFAENVIMQHLINVNYDNIGGFQFIMLVFFQGVFHVISLVVVSIMSFTLVFKGADMIIALFGFKDSGVNIKEIVGSDIEGKSGKYHNVT